MIKKSNKIKQKKIGNTNRINEKNRIYINSNKKTLYLLNNEI